VLVFGLLLVWRVVFLRRTNLWETRNGMATLARRQGV
jgi:hypothetical protein